MKISESITIYYQSEIRHCLITSVSTGIVMLLLSLLLFWLSMPSHSVILKGVSLIVFIGSLVFGLGGYFAGKAAQKSMAEKIALFERSQQEFATQEFAKVEAIHKNWRQIKILWATVVLIGLIVLFISSHTVWTGLGIGFLIIGTIGMIEETISMQHNEKYRTEVLTYKIQNDF